MSFAYRLAKNNLGASALRHSSTKRFDNPNDPKINVDLDGDAVIIYRRSMYTVKCKTRSA